MGKPETGFNVTFDNDYGRPCLIRRPSSIKGPENKENAMFHEWFVTESVASPRFNNSRNPLPWGQHSNIFGLVELEDGRMIQVPPQMIIFVDAKLVNCLLRPPSFVRKTNVDILNMLKGLLSRVLLMLRMPVAVLQNILP